MFLKQTNHFSFLHLFQVFYVIIQIQFRFALFYLQLEQAVEQSYPIFIIFLTVITNYKILNRKKERVIKL